MPTPATAPKQTMAELKLMRLTQHSARLREDLARPLMPISESAQTLIKYCSSTRDPLVPSVWGPPLKGEDPFAPQAAGGGGCCVVA